MLQREAVRNIVVRMSDVSWVDKLSRAMISWFSQREVKTPLSFYFRLVGALVVIAVAAAILIPDGGLRYKIFLYALGMLLVLLAVVTLFAWLNPKNLVYGETGHRAEMKLTYGTEKREMKQAEISSLPGTENPKALTNGGTTA